MVMPNAHAHDHHVCVVGTISKKNYHKWQMSTNEAKNERTNTKIILYVLEKEMLKRNTFTRCAHSAFDRFDKSWQAPTTEKIGSSFAKDCVIASTHSHCYRSKTI